MPTIMSPPPQPRRARPARLAWPAAAAAGFLLAACGTAGTAGAPASGPASAGSSASAGVAQAQAQIAKYSRPMTFKPAGSPLSGVRSALTGKTVYYVPITQQVPIFPVVESGLTQALAAAGAHLHVCDGGATPPATTACLNQAIADHAAAVVTDSIPFGFAQQGFLALESHHIPVLLGDEPAVGAAGKPVAGNDQLAFLETNQVRAMALSADWIIAHSTGKADVLVIKITDSPLTVQAITQGALGEFAARCPGCTVHTVAETTANLSTLPSLVSSALLKDPNIGYVFTEFDTDLQPALGGIIQTGRTAKVIGVSSMGILGSLQMLRAGNYLQEDTGSAGVLQGWQYADQVFRMLLHQPVLASEDIPQRVFTRDNVGTLDLSPAGQISGSWYVTNDFKTAFSKLWGLG
jgi:ribose transport system substrate-binding protein